LFRMYNSKMRLEFVRAQIELHNHLKSFKGGQLLPTPGYLIELSRGTSCKNQVDC
jgi:hypothetical protein